MVALVAPDSSGPGAAGRAARAADARRASLRYTTSIPEGTTVPQLRGVRGHGERRPLARSSPRPTAKAVYQIVYTLTSRPASAPGRDQRRRRPVRPRRRARRARSRATSRTCSCARPATPTMTLEGAPCDPDHGDPAASLPFVLAYPRDTTKLAVDEPLRLTGVMRLPDDVLVFRVIQYRTEVAHAISEPGCEGRFEWTMALPARPDRARSRWRPTRRRRTARSAGRRCGDSRSSDVAWPDGPAPRREDDRLEPPRVPRVPRGGALRGGRRAGRLRGQEPARRPRQPGRGVRDGARRRGLAGRRDDRAVQAGGHGNHERTRDRKLLLHRREIAKIRQGTDEKGYTLVPLRLYFKDGRVKIEVGLGRGKNVADKRQAMASRATRSARSTAR